LLVPRTSQDMIEWHYSVHPLLLLIAAGLAGLLGFCLGRRRGAPGALFPGRWFNPMTLSRNPVLANLSDGVIVLSVSNRIIDFNPAAENLAGFPPAAAIGQPINRVWSNFPDLAENGRQATQIQTEIVIATGKTPRCYDLQISPLKNRRGDLSGRLVVVRDITERKRTHEQRQQAQKRIAIGQLAGGVAHQFNNIMAVIQGYTAMVLEQPNLPSNTVNSLKLVASSSDRAARLTQQLLAYSERQWLEMRHVYLNQALGNQTQKLRRLLGDHIALSITHRLDTPVIEADLGMIEQVVINLALNARDAMPEGGELHIGIDPVNIGLAEAQQNPDARIGQFACLSLADTGCGMDEATMDHLFEPFFTTKDVGQGTGLGLAAVYGIVKQHLGWIEVSSVPGRGTTFKIYFPASTTPVASVAQESTAGPARQGPARIVLTEEHPGVRDGIAEVRGEGEADLVLKRLKMREGISGIEKKHSPSRLAKAEEECLEKR
jgi:two-component system, cell cycle sensor histidine kinase and response regulator CckA